MNIKKNKKYLSKILNGELKIKTSAVEDIYGKSLFPKGNKKLNPKIWSFSYSSGTNCPSDKLGLCNICTKCYAKKTETIYKNQDCFDKKNKSFFYSTSPKHIAGYLIQKSINSKKYPLEVLRLNVAGDFRKATDLKRFDEIAYYLYEVLGVKTYCYTKRTDLIPELKKLKYIHVNISENQVKGFSSYTAFKTEADRKTALKDGSINAVCNCGDCYTCKKCIDKNLNIGCLIH